MDDRLFKGLSTALLSLLPLLYLQGRWVRRRVPVLPEASGPVTGCVPGPLPSVRLLAIGESTVAGVGAPTHAEALTGQVAVALSDRWQRGVCWRALGRRGVDVREVHRLLLPALQPNSADLVLIAMGVNDVLRFRSPASWVVDLQRLILGARRKLGPVPVVLAPVPRMDLFPALPQPLRAVLGLRARLLDRAAHQMASRTPLVSHTPLSMDPRAAGFFCTDGFHPSVTGYAAWAAQLVQATPRVWPIKSAA